MNLVVGDAGPIHDLIQIEAIAFRQRRALENSTIPPIVHRSKALIHDRQRVFECN